MSKKTIKNSEARKYIIKGRDDGKTDQEIYNDLSEKYYDKLSIAKLIIGTVTRETRQKYRIPNAFLLASLVLIIIFKIIAGFDMSIDTSHRFEVLADTIFIPLINLFLIFEVYRFQVSSYIGIASITLFSVTLSLNYASKTNPLFVLVDLAIAGSAIILSLFLSAKLRSNFNPKDLKKDAYGEYIMPDLSQAESLSPNENVQTER